MYTHMLIGRGLFIQYDLVNVKIVRIKIMQTSILLA